MSGIKLGGKAFTTIGVPYSKVPSSTYSIWHVPLAGGAPRQITADTASQQATPIVDPIGRRRLVYLKRVVGGDLQLRIVNADGSGDSLIDAGHHRLLDWKPDGSKILFCTFNSGEEHQLIEIEPDGSNRTVIYSSATPGSDFLTRMQYSPDGSQIAFFRDTSSGTGTGELWVMDSDGTNDTMIDSGLGDVYVSNNALSWSPDGTLIGYGDGHNTFNGFGNFYVIAPDGSGKTLVGTQTDPGDDAFASRSMWTPDGAAILVLRFTNDPRWEIVRMEADGSGESLLSPRFHVDTEPPLVFGSRVYAVADVDSIGSVVELRSSEVSGADSRQEDPAANILLEWFE